jgi:hypothetical protein
LTKDELLEQIKVDRRRLERYLFYFEKDEHGEFSPSKRLKFKVLKTEEAYVYEDWTIKDLLAHLSGWQVFFLEWYDHHRHGRPFAEFWSDSSWADKEQINRIIFSRDKDRALDETLDEFRLSHQRIIKLIGSLTEDESMSTRYFPWTGEVSLADYITPVTWEHYRWAKSFIRSWSLRGGKRGMDKESILVNIQTERRRLEKNLADLTAEDMVAKGVIGDWSVKDILAHLVNWEQRFLNWYQAGLRGEIPQTPAPGMTWRDLDQLNQMIYLEHKEQTLESVMADFKDSYQQILQTMSEISEEDIFPVGRFAWTGNENLAAYIKANTANHYRWAKTQIRKWLRERST